MHTFFNLVCFSTGLILLSACSTGPEGAASQPQTVAGLEASPSTSMQDLKPVARFPIEQLRTGMDPVELETLFGRPEMIENLPEDPQRAQVWVYRRLLGTEIKEVPAGTREVPVWAGPGQKESIKMVKEVILRKELTTITEVTRLLLYEGKYVEKKQQYDRAGKYIE